ncbi:response regulator [bacterium]|nr:MAG: response regulator [bacterium]
MPKKILLADDSITIQKVITITFATEDYDIIIVGDGNSAVKKAKELKPDLILADVSMPGKSGYEVCEAIKSDPVLRHIPVMLLAGTFEPLNKAEAERVKSDDSIVKPFESQELIEKVATLLLKNISAPVEEIAEIPAVELEPAELSVEPFEAPVVAPPPPPKAPVRPAAPPPPSPKAAEPEPEIGGIDEMFGPSGAFLGAEEDTVNPVAESREELSIGEQGSGFLDEPEIPEGQTGRQTGLIIKEGLKPPVVERVAVKPAVPKVESPKPKVEPEPIEVPPWRVAPPPPSKAPPAPPKADIIEPQFEPMAVPPSSKVEPPKPKVEPIEPQFEPMTFEPPKDGAFEVPSFDFSNKATTQVEEPFWSEPISNAGDVEQFDTVSENIAPEPADVFEAEKPVSSKAGAPPPPKAEPLEPRRGPEPIKEPVKETPSFAMKEAHKPVVSKVVESAVKEAEARVVEEAGERLRGVGISKDNLEQTIAKIAREVIEEIAWEVVPELAEELIAAEFQRFKESWAKSK